MQIDPGAREQNLGPDHGPHKGGERSRWPQPKFRTDGFQRATSTSLVRESNEETPKEIRS